MSNYSILPQEFLKYSQSKNYRYLYIGQYIYVFDADRFNKGFYEYMLVRDYISGLQCIVQKSPM